MKNWIFIIKEYSMNNRFNLNEEEKGRIRGLHYDEYSERKFGMWEQTSVEDTETDEILEALLDGSQRLQRYIKDVRTGRNAWSKEDLRDISSVICNNIDKMLE